MDKREKLEAMEKLLREIEDLKNSETAVLKKIGQIEAENINLGIQILEKGVPDLYETSDKLLEQIDALFTTFTEHKDKFVKDNKLDEVVEGQGPNE